MKTYRYNTKKFKLDVIFNGGIFPGFIFIASVALAINNTYRPLMFIVMLIAFYSVWNTFVSRCNSEIVCIDADTISFEAFNKKELYNLKVIKRFRIREFPSMGKMYIRIIDSENKQHRYWINTKRFNKGQELFRSLLDIEYKKHPDTLKARARAVNTQYINAKKSKISSMQTIEKT